MLPAYTEPLATRKAYGEALAALAAADPRVVILDADSLDVWSSDSTCLSASGVCLYFTMTRPSSAKLMAG